MKAARGLGRLFQPSYVNKRTGERKTCATWWFEYWVNGRRITKNAHSTNRADATRMLKKEIGDAAAGKPVGPELDCTTLDDLLAMVEADYQANSRRSLNRIN